MCVQLNLVKVTVALPTVLTGRRLVKCVKHELQCHQYSAVEQNFLVGVFINNSNLDSKKPEDAGQRVK